MKRKWCKHCNCFVSRTTWYRHKEEYPESSSEQSRYELSVIQDANNHFDDEEIEQIQSNNDPLYQLEYTG